MSTPFRDRDRKQGLVETAAMMTRLCWFCMLTLFLAAGPMPEASAQTIEVGRWPGFVTPPGGSPYKSTFVVTHRGDSLVVRMTVAEWGEEFPIHNVHFNEYAIRFWWQPHVRVDCELDPDELGVFRGQCWDASGNAAPMVMAPPGYDLDAELQQITEAAEASKRENAKWKLRRELDRVDGPLGDMVDIGGFKLNALAEGQGSASVVLLSDIGVDLRTWDYVLHDVKEFARVISYSRAGIGYSEESSTPTSMESAVTDLHVLLARTGVAPPFVIVGQGYGATIGQVFASMYPDQIGGMVLIDPVQQDVSKRLWEAYPQSWNTYWSRRKKLFEIVPEAVKAEFEVYRSFVESDGVVGSGKIPQVPLVVISNLHLSDMPRWVGETKEGLEVKNQVHAEFVSRFEHGVHLIADDSGRLLVREDPDLITQAVRQVLSQMQLAESVVN